MYCHRGEMEMLAFTILFSPLNATMEMVNLFLPIFFFYFFNYYSLSLGYKLLIRCGRVIHRSWHYKYYNNLMHKMSQISLKCCLKALVTYKSGEFPCLHLIAPLLRFWLQRSQLSRATCFIGVTPVWAQGTKKKRNSLKLLLLLFFKNKKCLKKIKNLKKNKPNLGHFCNRLNPSLNKKTLQFSNQSVK